MVEFASIHLGALCGAAFLNAAIPGPGFALAANRTARRGVPSGLKVSLGVVAGMMAAMFCALGAMLGVLHLSPLLFEITRWAGIVVLFGLAVVILLPGLGRWVARPLGAGGPVVGSRVGAGDVVSGLLVGVTNPALVVFLLALLPQFVGSGSGAALRLGLGVSAFGAGAVVGMLCGVAFGLASVRLTGGKTRWLDFVAGGALLGVAGLALVTPGGS